MAALCGARKVGTRHLCRNALPPKGRWVPDIAARFRNDEQKRGWNLVHLLRNGCPREAIMQQLAQVATAIEKRDHPHHARVDGVEHSPRGYDQFAVLPESCAAQFRHYASALREPIKARCARSQTVQDALRGQWIIEGDEVDDLQQIVAGFRGPLDAPFSHACGFRDARSISLAPMQILLPW